MAQEFLTANFNSRVKHPGAERLTTQPISLQPVCNGAEGGNGMESVRCRVVYEWADFRHLMKL